MLSCNYYSGSGTIELNEFITMMQKRLQEVDEEAELRESFKIFDKDGKFLTNFKPSNWTIHLNYFLFCIRSN